jgi:hypothetical protein
MQQAVLNKTISPGAAAEYLSLLYTRAISLNNEHNQTAKYFSGAVQNKFIAKVPLGTMPAVGMLHSEQFDWTDKTQVMRAIIKGVYISLGPIGLYGENMSPGSFLNQNNYEIPPKAKGAK